MKWKQLLLIVAISALSARECVDLWQVCRKQQAIPPLCRSADGNVPGKLCRIFRELPPIPADPIDFTKAANAAVPAVVHIKTKIAAKK